MGLESAHQYFSLLALSTIPVGLQLSMLPFDVARWIEAYRSKHEKNSLFLRITFTWFVILTLLSVLFFVGAMYEVVRDGGSYGGWETRPASLVWGLVAVYCSTIWIPFWLNPVYGSYHYTTSHVQMLSLIFSWGSLIWYLNYTQSAWFVLPLALWNTLIFVVVWNYEENHETLMYIGGSDPSSEDTTKTQ